MRKTDPDAFEVELGVPALPASAAEVIRVLANVVTDSRLEKIRQVAASRTHRVVPVLEHLADPHNGSAIIRSADAFGIAEMHVVPGEHGFFASRPVTRGTHRWLDMIQHDTSEACADELIAQGYEIFVASMEGSVRPSDLAKKDRVAVVFGNERYGPSEKMRARASGTYAIPMRGFVESLNVSVAAAITLHGITEGRAPELDKDAQDLLVARMLLRTLPSARAVLADAGYE